ncbi:MAG: D-alanyl-D-alanine carboxypeptidase [Micavibrio aeruginosavorus]|uniref:D-alanyl-D-alanine carboxypeptidase n=1 Tax=Micavibrio aeruginosavorus TaxID=349221 RepID=A0A2W5BXS7_9BACT|nr:MAG: D-alanyl-D-alanine carboxypeptidase [Micavibrio aeruginosavorus]
MRRLTAFILILSTFLALPQGVSAKAKSKAESGNDKYASIVIDAATGQVISEQNANASLYPASLTKVMTLMMLFEAMESGNVRLNDKIAISARAAAQQPSKIGLSAGSSIRVEDAILALVTKSANDISVAIAEHLAGSEDRFALRMTRRAQDIGMTRTTFRNASGLPNAGQKSSARDMATLARYIITRYPNYYRYFSTKQFTYRGVTYNNHNRLMQSYPGMDGFKTGFINASGFNLIASARRDGRRLIGVVFGGKTWKSRNDHMASLLDRGFGQMGEVRYAGNSGQIERVPVVDVTQTAAVAPMPRPAPKPDVPASVAQAPEAVEVIRATRTVPQQNAPSYTSLSSLETGRQLVVPSQTLQLPAAKRQDAADIAVADIKNAMNRGDYSEVTGQGDFDAGNARRIETALITAAVYKGDHDKVQQISAARVAPAPDQPAQVPAQIERVSIPSTEPQPYDASRWSVQIGAYNSRVATDDALRLAHRKLPEDLTHASPVVVPLKTSEGLLFRARLGNLTQAQATEACRHFRDCLPVAPR